MITIKDIAKAAGVTHATVSRALNNEPGVSESVKQKILMLAEQMNYVPNMAAKKLVRQKTNLIGLIWPVVDGLFFYNLSVEIQKQGAGRGFPVIMSSASPVEAMRIFNQIAVDYIIFWNGNYGNPSIDFLKETERFSGQLLTMGGGKIENANCLSIDRRSGLHHAVRHLAELGHRKIAFAGADPNKLNGYMQGIAEYKLDYSADLIIDPLLPGFEQMVAELLRTANRPTSFIAESQGLLFQVLRIFRELGLHIPTDLSVIVYDDVPELEIFEIPFTTVGPAIQDLASKALDIVTTPKIDGESGTRADVIPAKLTIRRSTAAPPAM